MPDENVIPNGPYTVRQLIEALQKCTNQDAPVNVYLLNYADEYESVSERYPVASISVYPERDGMVDINAVTGYAWDAEKE